MSSGVTVLMPVYNAERYLRPAIDSVLSQTYRELEFLIVNDGSTDSSRKIIASYDDPRIRLVDNERNCGLTATLNRGLRLATYDLIARQDADDISHPERLAKEVTFLSDNPSVALVGTQAKIIDESGFSKGRLLERGCETNSIRWDLLFDNSFTHTSVLFRKDIILKLGAYDESFKYCQDYDLWSRVTLAHRVGNLPSELVSYRVHPFCRMSDNLRALIADENRRIMQRNMQVILGRPLLLEDAVDLAVGVRFEFDESKLLPFLRVLRESIAHYQILYPETVTSKDFHETVARRYARVAYKVWLSRPLLAWRVIADAAFRYPVLKVSGLWLGGALVGIAEKILSLTGQSVGRALGASRGLS